MANGLINLSKCILRLKENIRRMHLILFEPINFTKACDGKLRKISLLKKDEINYVEVP